MAGSPGFLVVFEGGEGTGKTTQIKLLEKRLAELGYQVYRSWEPGGTPLGERVRTILLDPETGEIDGKTETLLYAAARAEHVEKVLRPKLQAGFVILCDRYRDASRAYQGAGRGLGVAQVDHINTWATGGLEADWTFLFDLDPRIGLRRAEERSGEIDRVEAAGQSFHDRVRGAYLDWARPKVNSHLLVDASASVEEISELLWQTLKDKLPPTKPS